jgi:hypothetical protein
MFKNWTWQKWVSRGSKFVVGVVLVFFKLIAPEATPDWMPNWWIILSPLILLVVDAILGLFPTKQTT